MNNLIEQYILIYKRMLFHSKMKWKDIKVIEEPFDENRAPESYKYHKKKQMELMKRKIKLENRLNKLLGVDIFMLNYNSLDDLRKILYDRLMNRKVIMVKN